MSENEIKKEGTVETFKELKARVEKMQEEQDSIREQSLSMIDDYNKEVEKLQKLRAIMRRELFTNHYSLMNGKHHLRKAKAQLEELKSKDSDLETIEALHARILRLELIISGEEVEDPAVATKQWLVNETQTNVFLQTKDYAMTLIEDAFIKIDTKKDYDNIIDSPDCQIHLKRGNLRLVGEEEMNDIWDTRIEEVMNNIQDEEDEEGVLLELV